MVTFTPETPHTEQARQVLQREGLYDDLVVREQRMKRSTPEEATVKVDTAIGYYLDSLGTGRAQELMEMQPDERAGKLHKVVSLLIEGVDFSGVEGRTKEVDRVIKATRAMIGEIEAYAVKSQRTHLRGMVRNAAATRAALKIEDNDESLDRVIKMAVRNVVIKYGPDKVNEWEGPELSVAISMELENMEATFRRNAEKWTATAPRGRIGPTQTTRALGGNPDTNNPAS